MQKFFALWQQSAKSLSEHGSGYISFEEHVTKSYNQFVEKDARKAGRAISKYVKEKAFTPLDFLSDLYMKLRTICGK